MKIFRNQNQPLKAEVIFENVVGQSKTIPAQAMTNREILHRLTSGQSTNINSLVPTYYENVPLYDVRRKHNIDIAVDKIDNEKNIMQKQKEIFDDSTRLSEILKSKKQVQQSITQEVISKPSE